MNAEDVGRDSGDGDGTSLEGLAGLVKMVFQ